MITKFGILTRAHTPPHASFTLLSRQNSYSFPKRHDEAAEDVKYLKEDGKFLVVVTFMIEAIGRVLLTAQTRAQSRGCQCEMCDGESDSGRGFH
jgi:hypothetical protein